MTQKRRIRKTLDKADQAKERPVVLQSGAKGLLVKLPAPKIRLEKARRKLPKVTLMALPKILQKVRKIPPRTLPMKRATKSQTREKMPLMVLRRPQKMLLTSSVDLCAEGFGSRRRRPDSR
jgi:hypothetical protein